MKQYQILGLLFCTQSLFCSSINQSSNFVEKLFHHRVDNIARSIEIGSVVLYLQHKPQITSSSKMVGQEKQTTYFLPQVSVRPSAKKSVEQLNQETGKLYKIVIQAVTVPNKGLQITFTYNPNNVGISYERFDSITLKKGVVFRLFNKKVISKMQTSKPIIKVAANIPRVVIDCGHGGDEPGAIGCCNIKEKDVNLQVGMQVAQLLRKNDVVVSLVRQSDTTCLLDERTTFANAQEANLFVSIHSNASIYANESGIETYCLSPNLFSQGDTTLAQTECLLAKKMLYEKYTQSGVLARTIHHAILNAVQMDYSVKDRHIKQSVAQVLLGTTMPAVLVELGFLTNQKESELLIQKQYQSRLALGIVDGILSYLGRA